KPEERLLLVSAAPIEYDDKKQAIVILEDITELNQLRKRLKVEHSFAGIIGRDDKILELFDTIKELAEATVTVLVLGESGTGKELVASAIHNEGPRKDKQFVPVNCGALPDGLLESELFGHVKGAFTGAIRDKKGRFELADGGTIFLDEVGDLSPAMQVKLLRVLQTGCFERVGGEKTIKVDVRIISATNKSLEKEIAAGRFREDLYYRLCVVPINMPPLRERISDVPLLAEYFIEREAKRSGQEKISLSSEALAMLMDYNWPGNVRELQNVLQFALVKCHGQVIEPQHLPLTIQKADMTTLGRSQRKRKLTSKAVADALRQSKGNRLKAAKLLGVSRATLYRFLAEEKEFSGRVFRDKP
ncbi:MAG: sigma-54-dependent Fis family transcriptional regulator, partial [Deltaproteobacteria bacterium]